AEVVVAVGNKLKVSYDGKEGTKPVSGRLISDGMQTDDSLNPARGLVRYKTPKELTEDFTYYFSRLPVLQAATSAPGAIAIGLDKLDVKDFKLGTKEQTNDPAIKIIEFTMVGSAKAERHCQLWIDTKTNLPTRRIVDSLDKNKMSRMVEAFY